MPDPLLVISTLVLIATVAFAIGFAVHQRQERRFHVQRYDGDRHRVPRFAICPSCNTRSYARRAVMEGYCPSCDFIPAPSLTPA